MGAIAIFYKGWRRFRVFAGLGDGEGVSDPDPKLELSGSRNPTR